MPERDLRRFPMLGAACRFVICYEICNQMSYSFLPRSFLLQLEQSRVDPDSTFFVVRLTQFNICLRPRSISDETIPPVDRFSYRLMPLADGRVSYVALSRDRGPSWSRRGSFFVESFFRRLMSVADGIRHVSFS